MGQSLADHGHRYPLDGQVANPIAGSFSSRSVGHGHGLGLSGSRHSSLPDSLVPCAMMDAVDGGAALHNHRPSWTSRNVRKSKEDSHIRAWISAKARNVRATCAAADHTLLLSHPRSHAQSIVDSAVAHFHGPQESGSTYGGGATILAQTALNNNNADHLGAYSRASSVNRFRASSRGHIVTFSRGLEGIPLRHLISQVCGGALYSVAYSNNELVFTFFSSSSASRFYHYARTGNYVVMGKSVLPDDSVAPELSPNTSMLRKFYKANGAKRILMLSRFVQIGYSVVVRSEVDMDQLKQAFGSIEGLLNIRPMVMARQVAFAIEYTNVVSAAAAKTAFERHGGDFEQFYRWRLEFVPDPAEAERIV